MRTYLDHNASAPLRPEARQAINAALDRCGNASSPHREGQAARGTVEQAREEVAVLVGASPNEVVFTGTGTEAINLAVRGAVHAFSLERHEVIVCATEHDAVMQSADALGTEGIRTTIIGVDGNGVIDLAALAAAVTDRTALVALMMANNEVGTIQPVAEAREITRRTGTLLLTDAVQAAGKIAVDFRGLGVDLLSVSAHKIGGPQGVGALVARRGVPLEPLVYGGGHELGRRAGTENVAGIAGFAAAAVASLVDLERETNRIRSIRDRFEEMVVTRLPDTSIIGKGAPRLAGTSSVQIAGADAQALVVRLDLDGFALSTGSACSSGAAEASHVLTAMGIEARAALGTLRVSFGWSSEQTDAERVVAALGAAVESQRAEGILTNDRRSS